MQPTRHNVTEIRKVRCHIQGKPVRRDPAAQVNADGGNLRAPHPNTCHARGAPGCDAKTAKGPDQHFFQSTNIKVHVPFPAVQIQDWITQHLPRTMICHVAAAVGFFETNPRTGQQFFAGEQIFAVSVAAHGNNVGVLGIEQLVTDQACLSVSHGLLLQHQGIAPADRPKVPHSQI